MKKLFFIGLLCLSVFEGICEESEPVTQETTSIVLLDGSKLVLNSDGTWTVTMLNGAVGALEVEILPDGTVLAIDPSGKRLIKIPDGKEIWTLFPSGNTVTLHRSEDGKVIFTSPNGIEYEFEVLPDGTEVYTKLDSSQPGPDVNIIIP